MATDIPAPADIAQPADGSPSVQPTAGGTQQQGSCPPAVTPEDDNFELPPDGMAPYVNVWR